MIIVNMILITTSIYGEGNKIADKNIEINEDLGCWIGWKEIHCGMTNPVAKRGDISTFKGKPMIIGGEYIEGAEYDVTTNGYGSYALNFSKHMIGFLSYMKKNIESIGDYVTNYIPKTNTLKEYEKTEEGKVKLSDAIEIAINDILSNNYSKKYEEGEFRKFWDGIFFVKEDEEKKEKERVRMKNLKEK